MKLLLLLAALLLFPLSGHSEQGIYRDRDGGFAGSWSGNDHWRDYRGRDGGYAGSAERDGSGWTYRDSAGGYAGSSTGPSDRNPFVRDRDDD